VSARIKSSLEKVSIEDRGSKRRWGSTRGCSRSGPKRRSGVGVAAVLRMKIRRPEVLFFDAESEGCWINT
jgi:hypothetical protein